MANSRVTITLGRSGKVVKSGDNAMAYHRRMSGNKRFIQDKPWSNGGADNNFMPMNKRHRGDAAKWRSGGFRAQGSGIARNDLRLKLISKRRPHHIQRVSGEHRNRDSEKLSKDIRPPQNLSMHPHRPGPEISNLNPITNNGITDGLRFYPLQTMDGSRCFAEMPQVKPTASARADFFSSNGVFYPYRETGVVPVTDKAITAGPVTYVAQMSGIMQRTHADEEPSTVTTFLHSLGLGKYAIHFKVEEVDMTALRQMRDRDLKELGIPMGPRKKLLLALMPPSKRHLSRMRC